MRRPVFRMEREPALALLSRAPYVHVATTTAEGQPVFRTLHGVICEGHLAFHAGPKGEKVLSIGREAVVSAAEMVAELPSSFFDPVRACPATTYYESVQLHGVLEPVECLDQRARYMQALMERYQPGGGYQEIRAEDPLYTKALKALLVLRVSLERLVGKSKLGQNLRPETLRSVLEQLWQRGRSEDIPAIRRILAANPDTPTPSFLQAPEGVELCCEVVDEAHIQTAAQMLDGAYWNAHVSIPEIAEALRHSSVLVGAKDAKTGTLIGIMRGVSDQSKHGWLYDVMVAPEWRGRGVGRALMRMFLDHPKNRGLRMLHLQTKDAQEWYRSFGFCAAHELPPRGFHSERMVLSRP